MKDCKKCKKYKKNLIFIYLLSIFLAVAFVVVVYHLLFGNVFERGYKGSYHVWSKQIVLKPDFEQNIQEYADTSLHEYGHYVYFKVMNTKQKNIWFETLYYNMTYNSYVEPDINNNKYVEEEFAECFAMVYRKDYNCSSDAVDFISKYIYLVSTT